jgi:hypothetical protein
MNKNSWVQNFEETFLRIVETFLSKVDVYRSVSTNMGMNL